MCCEHFDPITASCAPCCWVCSYRGSSCDGERSPVNQTDLHKKAALDAANIGDGRAQQVLRTAVGAFSLSEAKGEIQV